MNLADHNIRKLSSSGQQSRNFRVNGVGSFRSRDAGYSSTPCSLCSGLRSDRSQRVSVVALLKESDDDGSNSGAERAMLDFAVSPTESTVSELHDNGANSHLTKME